MGTSGTQVLGEWVISRRDPWGNDYSTTFRVKSNPDWSEEADEQRRFLCWISINGDEPEVCDYSDNLEAILESARVRARRAEYQYAQLAQQVREVRAQSLVDVADEFLVDDERRCV